jgi:DNA-binding NarL/FixJ family response regulator
VRVLVVDDSNHIRLLLAVHIEMDEHLELSGQACNGRDGVDQAVAQRPDAVILDQEMPILDGLGALREIREALPDATIVMYSSADPALREQALQLGANAFFQKGTHDPAQIMEYLVEARR